MNLAIRDVDELSRCLATAGDEPHDIDQAARRYAQTRQEQLRRALRRTHLLGLAADRPFTARRLALVRLLNITTPAKKALLRSMMDVR